MRVHLTSYSSNRKTGPIPVSMSSQDTCPESCGMRSICYAHSGWLSIQWRRLEGGALGGAWQDFLEAVRNLTCKIWRHNQAGDLPRAPGNSNLLDRYMCRELTRVNRAGGRNRGGFTFTHYPVLEAAGLAIGTARFNREVVREMSRGGFAVNLSADNVEQADLLSALGTAPVTVLVRKGERRSRFKTPEGRTVLLCRSLVSGLQCKDCRLCQRRDRKSIVAFPAHGRWEVRATQLAQQRVLFEGVSYGKV